MKNLLSIEQLTGDEIKDLLALGHRSGVVQMNDYVFSTLNGFKCLFNDMFSCLSQNLNRYIIRNQIPFDQCTAEFIFCLRSSWETNLDFFKANIN